MSGIACLRNIQKVMNRLNPKTITKTNLCITQNVRRSISISNIRKFKIVPTNRNEVNETKKKPWVSYGFSFENEQLDKHLMNLTFFVTISVVMTFGGYVLMYLPDFRRKDWALREAYLELRRRESLGLPPIDPNYFDPANIPELPEDPADIEINLRKYFPRILHEK